MLENTTNVTNVEEKKASNIPNKFFLAQNYPNPFNPFTTIQFWLPKQSYLSLKIYNTLGEEVKNLIEEELDAGSYEIEFDAAGLTSGIYLYTIITKEFIQTKKMIVMK